MKKIFTIVFIILAAVSSFAKSKVLIVAKEQEDFKKLTEFLQKEMGKDYESIVVNIEKGTEYSKFEAMIKGTKANLIVLMDNQAVSLGQEYYLKNPKDKTPSVALMGLNFKKMLKGDTHICGIAYEVAAYSILTQFRTARADKKVKTVLTFYRGSQFEDVMSEAKQLAKMEKIEIVAIDVEKKPDLLGYLKTEGKTEINSGKYDSVYVLLDSGLLEKKNFLEFWLPTAKEAKIPFLIGTEKFVDPSFDFAMYGMSPNLKEMAGQAIQMIESLLAGEKCQRIEDLIGVTSFWNDPKSEKLDIKLDEKEKNNVNILK